MIRFRISYTCGCVYDAKAHNYKKKQIARNFAKHNVCPVCLFIHRKLGNHKCNTITESQRKRLDYWKAHRIAVVG